MARPIFVNKCSIVHEESGDLPKERSNLLNVYSQPSYSHVWITGQKPAFFEEI